MSKDIYKGPDFGEQSKTESTKPEESYHPGLQAEGFYGVGDPEFAEGGALESLFDQHGGDPRSAIGSEALQHISWTRPADAQTSA